MAEKMPEWKKTLADRLNCDFLLWMRWEERGNDKSCHSILGSTQTGVLSNKEIYMPPQKRLSLYEELQV